MFVLFILVTRLSLLLAFSFFVKLILITLPKPLVWNSLSLHSDLKPLTLNQKAEKHHVVSSLQNQEMYIFVVSWTSQSISIIFFQYPHVFIAQNNDWKDYCPVDKSLGGHFPSLMSFSLCLLIFWILVYCGKQKHQMAMRMTSQAYHNLSNKVMF